MTDPAPHCCWRSKLVLRSTKSGTRFGSRGGVPKKMVSKKTYNYSCCIYVFLYQSTYICTQIGLLGSKHYVQNLSPDEANSILTYLNFDMVSRGTFNVFDGDGSTFNLTGAPGSDTIEKMFVDHLVQKGINVTAAQFTGGSDYQSFMNIGKPVGGMNTGTRPDQDACYHQACDTIENPNPNTLTVISKVSSSISRGKVYRMKKRTTDIDTGRCTRAFDPRRQG